MNRAATIVPWGTFLLCGVGLPSQASAQKPEVSAVQVQMRHVDFHVDSSIVLKIESLRGELQPTSPDHFPYFDDKSSFVLSIDSARIGITPASLGDLLNRYTFAYPGSPLRRLRISVEKGQIRQQGTMRGIAFNILADLTLTPTGELRLHPSSVKAAGIGVGGLMKFFGLHLEKLVKLEGVRGVRIDQDDFYLDPPRLLPPPLVKGRVGGVQVTDSAMVLTFQPPDSSKVKPLTVPDPKAANYMFYRGGVLRFGKLTMHDADLMIVDANPQDPFDFYLDHYNAQLVAGYEKNTPDHGLIVVMQDYSRTPPLPGETHHRKNQPASVPALPRSRSPRQI
ncbi:MAG: hypothetical protein ACJ8AX_15010 [Gemmatimonadales bacterium]